VKVIMICTSSSLVVFPSKSYLQAATLIILANILPAFISVFIHILYDSNHQ
jgi:hypothetical protein